jgi:hypothetical protein
MRVQVIFFGAAVAIATPAFAGMPVSQSAKCPVGGKTFTYVTTASYSTWGSRPDGKMYGSWEFPLALPICPDNGLVMFDAFSVDEVKQLKTILVQPEYRSIIGTETSYFRAYWLMKQLGRDPVMAAWVLVQASWQADDEPAKKARYQALYVEEIRKLEKRSDEVTWLIMQGRAVNGLRELGRFDEAATLLKNLPTKILDVQVPAENVSGTTPSGLGKQISNYDEIREAKRKRSFLFFFKTMESLITNRNASSEPVQDIPGRIAAQKCKNLANTLPKDEQDYCATDEMKKLIADLH